MRRLLIALPLFFFLALAALFYFRLGAGDPSQLPSVLVGKPAPTAALPPLEGLIRDGKPVPGLDPAKFQGNVTIVNVWASWCVPCRAEFGAFQGASVKLGRQVAFIGVDSGDTSRAAAASFLRAFPVSYPSYYDHSGAAGEAVSGSSFTPVTVFYDRSGAQYIRQGPYPSQARLEQDVRRYALGGAHA